MSARSGAARRVAARVVLAAVPLLAACGAGRPPARTAVQVAPVPVAAVDTARRAEASLPELAVSQMAGGRKAETRLRINAVDADVRGVLRQIADQFGLQYEIAPEVRGRVTARLDGASLQQALDAVILPQGLSYSVQEGVLRVTPTRMQTRIFHLDYVALSRTSFGITSLQRTLGGAGGAGGAGGGLAGGGGGIGGGGMGGGMMGGAGGGGGAFITTAEGGDLWRGVRVAMSTLIFGEVIAPVQDATAGGGGMGAMGGMGGMGGSGPDAFGHVSEDGRRLIINPVAGTILVTAPPAVLAEVDTYLRSFESSVQRQVLIEAKIVEVALNRRSEFGIDWNNLSRLGGVQLSIRSGTQGGGLAFTLQGPAGSDSSGIGVVLRALQSQGEVRVLSSPHVSVLNNQRAIFNVSTDEVFFKITREPILGPNGGTIGFNTDVEPQTIAVGISLDVLAQVAPDNVITMNVHPSVTNVVRTEQVLLENGTQLTAPVIDRRETDTMVRIRAGETIVIGGLMQSVQRNVQNGVPILRDIPLIGGLFRGFSRGNERRELVIFLTPTIVASQAPAARE